MLDDSLLLAGTNEKFIEAIRHYSMHSDEIVDRAEPSNRYIALCRSLAILYNKVQRHKAQWSGIWEIRSYLVLDRAISPCRGHILRHCDG